MEIKLYLNHICFKILKKPIYNFISTFFLGEIRNTTIKTAVQVRTIAAPEDIFR